MPSIHLLTAKSSWCSLSGMQWTREELGDDLPGAVYSILAEETSCVAHKEFLTLVIRYVSATTGGDYGEDHQDCACCRH